MAPHLSTIITALARAQFTKQDLLMQAYTTFASEPDVMDEVGKYLYTAQCDADLAAFNYLIEGMNISYTPPAGT